MFHKETAAHVVALLLKLRNTAVPKGVDSGEELTYTALKDEILNNAISTIDVSILKDPQKAKDELCVDHQQLAHAVIERTFDTHIRMLRQKLREAEEEAEMWRKVTLYGRKRSFGSSSTDPSAFRSVSKELHRCKATQTDVDLIDSDNQIRGFISATQSWFSEQAANWLAVADAKFNAIETAHFDFLSQCIHSRDVKCAGAASDRKDRSSSEAASAEFQQAAGKLGGATRLGKAASKGIAPLKSPALKNVMDSRRTPVPPSAKLDEGTVFARQDITSPNACARDFPNNLTDTLYVLQSLHLNTRNTVSSLSASRAPLNGRRPLPSQLPQL